MPGRLQIMNNIANQNCLGRFELILLQKQQNSFCLVLHADIGPRKIVANSKARSLGVEKLWLHRTEYKKPHSRFGAIIQKFTSTREQGDRIPVRVKVVVITFVNLNKRHAGNKSIVK